MVIGISFTWVYQFYYAQNTTWNLNNYEKKLWNFMYHWIYPVRNIVTQKWEAFFKKRKFRGTTKSYNIIKNYTPEV